MTISGALLVPTSVLAAAAGVELPESEVLDVVDAVEAETSDSPEAVATTTATSEAPAAAGPVADLGDAALYDTADHEAYDEPTALPPGRPALALPPTARLRPIAGGRGIEMLHGVEMEVTVELGRTRMPVRELLALAPGAVLELDRAAGSPADLLVNGRLIARGEVVVVDEDFGLRVTEIINDESAAS
jgi:flagellar motor switch protein FliN/FliY